MKKTFLIVTIAVFFIPVTVLSDSFVDRLKEDRLYQNEKLVYTDFNCVNKNKGTTLNYKITDENSDSDFDVEVDGKAEVMETIEIYQ